LIRAIEIAKALGSVPKLSNPKSKYQVEWIMLDLPDAKLKTKISSRLKERVKSGMLREAKKLHESGVSFKRMESLGLECRSTARYLKNIITKNELIAELERDIWQYAKRQRTWFKKYAQ
jgi:tRNA dimethylallyltransferase